MKLPYLEFGDPNAPPLVLVHGLFGQGKNLAAAARAMTKTHYVMSVDLRNHGDAGWDSTHDYPAMAEDLLETFEQFGKIEIMGHSMGGKAAMRLSLSHPEFVRRILVADMAPVAYDHSHSPLIDAMKSMDLTTIKTRREADAALAPLVKDAGTRAFLIHGLKTGDQPKWKNNLEVLDANMDNITGWPKFSGSYTGPALFVGGENSDYINEDAREAIRQYFPAAKVIMIKDAGHWLHVEKPEIFANIMRAFFKA